MRQYNNRIRRQVAKNSNHRKCYERTRQDERTNARDKAREERVEGESADERAVDELDDASEDDIEEEEIDEFDPLCGGLAVVRKELWDGLHDYGEAT